jgi:hypothetical protein
MVKNGVFVTTNGICRNKKISARWRSTFSQLPVDQLPLNR